MPYVPVKPFSLLTRLVFCALIIIISVIVSCTKMDLSQQSPAQQFKDNFFTPHKNVSPQILGIIELLKRENAKHNFVNALPQSIGLPVWDKIQTRRIQQGLAKGDSGEHFIVIPFAPDGTYLTGLLIAVPSDTDYVVTYYSKELLKEVCYAQNKNVEQVENLLGQFMMMDNYLFGRTDFYHVPRDIFPTNARIILSDSTKIASLSKGGGGEENTQGTGLPDNCYLVPSGLHHPLEEGPCDWALSCSVCSAIYCGTTPPDFPPPPIPGGGGTPNPPPTTPPGGGGSGGDSCTTCPPPPGNCRMPFYVEDPCEPQTPPTPTDTIPTSVIVQMLHDENVAIKKQRDSVWDLAYGADEEYHFFIKKYNGASKAIGIKTDHNPNEVGGDRVVDANSNPDGDYHTHQDSIPQDRHPNDPQDVFAGNVRHLKLHYRSYVDCGDTLYVVVNENIAKMKAYLRYVHVMEYQDGYKNAVQSAGANRRKVGLQKLKELLGSSMVSGIGLYKSINADKTVFIKIN
jgi:hypothetical protein